MRAMPTISWRAGGAIIGLALIALTNAVTLGLVAYNRGGEPDAVLTLSGRELKQPWSGRRGAENSGLALALRWRVAPSLKPAGEAANHDVDDGLGDWTYGRAAGWLDDAKMAALGFSGDELRGRDGRHRGRARPVWLVLEFDGPAYGLALDHARRRLARETALRDANAGGKEFAERAKRAQDDLDAQQARASRLFVVDAGLDPAELRARYADRQRYAIVGGRVRPGWPDASRKTARRGWVEAIDPGPINVPHALRAAVPPEDERRLADVASVASAEFTAEVAFGRRLEPWIRSVAGARRGGAG